MPTITPSYDGLSNAIDNAVDSMTLVLATSNNVDGLFSAMGGKPISGVVDAFNKITTEMINLTKLLKGSPAASRFVSDMYGLLTNMAVSMPVMYNEPTGKGASALQSEYGGIETTLLYFVRAINDGGTTVYRPDNHSGYNQTASAWNALDGTAAGGDITYVNVPPAGSKDPFDNFLNQWK